MHQPTAQQQVCPDMMWLLHASNGFRQGSAGKAHLLQEQDLVVMRGKAVQVTRPELSHGLAQPLPKLIWVTLKAELLLSLLSEQGW